MLGKCFGVICIVSVLFAAVTGNLSHLSNAVIDGAARAVEVTMSLLGIMCLWCGVMRVLSDAGLIRKLSKLLSPVIRLAFPESSRTGIAIEEITASVSANILGVGNAATPLAIKAMEKMESVNPTPDVASDDMITLAVLGCSSIDIMPTTLIAIRRASESPEPYKIIVPIWICSVLCAFLSVFLSRTLSLFKPRGDKAADGRAGQKSEKA